VAPDGAAETDEALMLRYQDGELSAFDALYARYQGPLYRFLLRGCNAPEPAAEMFQDVWANVVRARRQYVPQAPFRAWLFRIAHNRLVDSYRRSLPDTATLDDVPAPEAPAHEQPEARQLAGWRAERLLNAITALPDEQRRAFLLKEEGGLSLEDIAQATGVGRETVKSRLRYALAKLREVLTDVL